jgi:hypothetical protein
VSFSVAYFEPRETVLMRAADHMNTLTDARDLKWGVQSGSPAQVLLRKIGVTQLHRYQSLADASTALNSKQIDAFVADNAISFGLAGLSNGRFHIAAQFRQPNVPGVYRAVLPKDSTNLETVNSIIDSLRDSGELDRSSTGCATATSVPIRARSHSSPCQPSSRPRNAASRPTSHAKRSQPENGLGPSRDREPICYLIVSGLSGLVVDDVRFFAVHPPAFGV